MNVILSHSHDENTRELVISGPELAANGFIPGASIGIFELPDKLQIQIIDDEDDWEELLASPDAGEGADIVQEDGTLRIDASWLEQAEDREKIRLSISQNVIIIHLVNDVFMA